ncbi:MAG: peptidylprolyl isomerase [Anaerolineales bacterium]|nr:peptidylprolyl isomerase [Anaerolineales bacterium]
MRKYLLFIVSIFLLVLSACQSNTNEPVVTPEPTQATAAESAPSPTPVAAEAETSASSSVAACTAASDGAEKQDFVLEGDWGKGAEDPAVTIVEYSDFQCPSCAIMEPILMQILEDFPDDIQLVYRHFPLIGEPDNVIHDKAAIATQAAEAAGRQDAFWEMHDILFAQQEEWTDMSEEDFIAWVTDQAAALDLDTEQFQTDMLSDELAGLAQNAWAEGVTHGFSGTPYILVDNRPLPTDYYSYAALKGVLESALIPLSRLTDRQYTECPPQVIDLAKEYTAILHTDLGDITIELYPEVAPFAVNSFVFLAQEDWYDGVKFHRVIPGFMAQGGDPSGTGYGGPGYMFEIEVDNDLKFDRAGQFAMANSGPTSNGSQFFITYDAAPHLDGQYTIFGEVIDGMDVVNAIAEPNADNPDSLPEVYIEDVTIEEK